MKNLKSLVQRGGERWVLTTPLSPEAAMTRLQREVETHQIRLSPLLFSGEVQTDRFRLMETSQFGKRRPGEEITGVITKTATGSEITILVRPLIPEGLSILLFLGIIGIGLGWLVYLVVLGQFPVRCFLLPALLIGVFVVVISASRDSSTSSYANLEGHFRRIFAVTTPTTRTSINE